MERLEKLKAAVEQGYTYNDNTGIIYGVKGREITNKTKAGYIQLQMIIDGKRYALYGHQLAWYITYGETVNIIDHINGERADNRIENLRSVTNNQNGYNQPKAKGYYLSKKTNKFNAQIKIEGKIRGLGSYDLEDDARQAYLNVKNKYHKF